MKSADYLQTDKLKIVGATKDIDAITGEDIQAIAKKYLSKGHILVVLYPEDKE